MKAKWYQIFFICLFLLVQIVSGNDYDPSVLTFDRIYTLREFEPENFGPIQWMTHKNGFTTVEPSIDIPDGEDIIYYDPESGNREILIPSRWLLPSGSDSPFEVDGYSWSLDGKWILVFTNTKRVWRENTRGDYWLLNLETLKLQQLGRNLPESSLMFAKFSPDGKRIAYVSEHNIYVESIHDGKINQLTFDGSDTIINGTFDWVYEEELDLRDGFRWSPDGSKIAYWQLDAEGVGVFYMVNNTDSIYSKIIPVQYPKVRTTNSACRVGVIKSTGGKTRWMNVEGDPRNNYIARMEWAANSDEIVIQHLNRLQNTNRVMLGDSRTGDMRTILTERDSTWTEVIDDMQWLENGQYFTWVSERDGWRHIYVVSRSGDDMRLVTPGNYDVISVEHIDDQNGWIYFIASPDDPSQRYLFRVPIAGSDKPERLSPIDQPGTHEYDISEDARWAIHTYSTFTTPPVIECVRLPDHTVTHQIVDNKDICTKLDVLKQHPTEFFRMDVGNGLKLDGWMIKPPDFDPDKKYPVLFFVYGEPWNQTVLDKWRTSRIMWHFMMADHGYLIVSIDNRGTPAPRGRSWRKSIYRQIGILASKDQAAAARTIAKWDFVDSTRFAIWGWSGGGSMTLNMLFRYPGLYHTGMSVAPVGYQWLYDTIYQERYMGLPDDNAKGYRDGSTATWAHQLEGNLLIVHGTGDDNVHYQNAEVVINELIKHNKPFTMMAYPNRSHGIYEGENTTRHLFELLTRFLLTNMPPN